MERIARTPISPNPRRAALLLAGLLLGAGGLFADGPSPTAAGAPGRSLADALRDLQARGLPIFFTTHLVRPEMRVAQEPAAGEPRAMLDELLAPHGLTAEAGPGGRLVVVTAGPGPSGIRGLVSERRSRRPLAGVRVLVPGTARETSSAADGSFLLSGIGAGTQVLEAHLPGFVVERVEEVSVPPGETAEILIELQPAPLALDEIVVTPSRITLLRDEPVSALDLDRDDILALPHLGDDIFRALTLLPGVTGEEVSARFNVRGGRTDEVLVLLDRVELFEPYHMKDYSSPFSIIAPRALREVNLITGGFPAQYGDRMSGVLDMSTVEADRRRTHVGLGTLTAEIGGSGTFEDRRGRSGHWFTSVRRGNLDLALEFLGQKQKPRYWDAFGKAEIQLRPRQRLGVHLLHSDDDLDFFNLDPDTEEDYLTSYGNSYVWLTHQAILGSRLFVDTAASLGRIDRDRQAREAELDSEDPGAGFTLIDKRLLDVAGFKQDWNLVVPGGDGTERHYLKWGFDVRRLETDYDYFNLRALDDPLEDIRFEPRTGTTSLRRRFAGEQHSGYVSDRLRPGRDGPLDALTVELGLRYDRHTVTADSNLSPRLNLVYATGPGSALRLAWGYFYQSQRPYELPVEDGVTELTSAERTEQRVLGFERSFAVAGAGRPYPGGSDLLLRVEAYQREITDPRARYENLYQPVEIFPEIEPDRVLIAPERSRAYGLEVFVRGSLGRRIEWWTSYAWSRVEDRIDGVGVPRRIDQPHAFTFDVDYRAGEHWNVNLAWRYHTGWPTTAFAGRLEEDDEGELEPVPVFGPLHGERLPDYHRLDLRASREWRLPKSVLGFFIEVQNVYDRQNVAGFDPDFEYVVRPGGEVAVVTGEEIWGRITPSFGVTSEF